MSEDCVVNQEEFQKIKTTVGVVKWMCLAIIALLSLVYTEMKTATNQNHLLTIEFVLLKDALNDHLKEQKKVYGYFADIVAKQELEKGKKKKKKKEYYATGGDS